MIQTGRRLQKRKLFLCHLWVILAVKLHAAVICGLERVVYRQIWSCASQNTQMHEINFKIVQERILNGRRHDSSIVYGFYVAVALFLNYLSLAIKVSVGTVLIPSF